MYYMFHAIKGSSERLSANGKRAGVGYHPSTDWMCQLRVGEIPTTELGFRVAKIPLAELGSQLLPSEEIPVNKAVTSVGT